MNIVHFNNARASKRKPPSKLPHAGLSAEIERIDRAICSKLVALRTGAGMTRLELANRCGVHPHQIAKYETGENRISASRLKVIAEVLECNIVGFLDELLEPMYKSSTECVYMMERFNRIKDDEIKECLGRLICLIAERVA